MREKRGDPPSKKAAVLFRFAGGAEANRKQEASGSEGIPRERGSGAGKGKRPPVYQIGEILRKTFLVVSMFKEAVFGRKKGGRIKNGRWRFGRFVADEGV